MEIDELLVLCNIFPFEHLEFPFGTWSVAISSHNYPLLSLAPIFDKIKTCFLIDWLTFLYNITLNGPHNLWVINYDSIFKAYESQVNRFLISWNGTSRPPTVRYHNSICVSWFFFTLISKSDINKFTNADLNVTLAKI